MQLFSCSGRFVTAQSIDEAAVAMNSAVAKVVRLPLLAAAYNRQNIRSAWESSCQTL
ncbi:hypothetical protein B0G75_101555 [Paraburkholderia sp. BL18I3N2]|nr:hypothetical protein B0G75_101555 [Paraburkholderia sp. BL18I3N2]